MQQIKVQSIIIIAFLMFWVGLTVIQVEAHESPTAGHPKLDILSDNVIAQWYQKVQKHPRNDQIRVKFGNALMQRARETGDLDYYPHAESAFQAALRLNPESSAAMVGMAWVHGALHQFEASIQWAEKTIAVDPQAPEAYGLLGDAAVEMGNYEAAYEHIQKMIDIRPDLSSYSRAGHLLFVTGDIQRAIKLMRKAIAAGGPFAENTIWCRAELAHMLWSTGDLASAKSVIRTGLEQTPHNHILLSAMGKLKAARSDFAAAIAAYEDAIAIRPTYNSQVALGDLYACVGQPDKAAVQFKEVEKLHHIHHENGVHSNILRARFYADHDMKLPAALAEAQRVYQKYKNVFVADTLAWCYFKNGRYQSARNVIEKALRFQTPDPRIWFHAGMIYTKLEEQVLARKHLKQALALNRNFHPVYAAVAKNTLKQLETQSSYGIDGRDAEI